MIIGKRNATAIGTLVERATGYTMLVHLPEGYTPELVCAALASKIQTLPAVLRQSLTWDQGPEMRDWKQVAIATDIDIDVGIAGGNTPSDGTRHHQTPDVAVGARTLAQLGQRR